MSDETPKPRASSDPAAFEITPPPGTPVAAARPTGSGPTRRPTTRRIIAVVGAENAPGLGMVRAILEDLKGEFAARAIVRAVDSPASRALAKMGADLLVADPRDEAALRKALAGAYGAFYIQLSSEHPSRETKFATANAMARAAKETGVHHVVWGTLEDPGQTFLEHNDVTPTFQNGRWISDRETGKSPEQVFTDLAVPTTFLHTSWEPSVAAGKWTEDIGRHAYGILRNKESVGETVSISAARLIRRLTPPVLQARAVESAPVPVPAAAPPARLTVSGVHTPASKPLIEPLVEQTGGLARERARSRTRTIAIVGIISAAALVGLVIVRQIQSQNVGPAREPVEVARASEPAGPPPPVNVAPRPEKAAPVPPPVANPPEAAEAPTVAPDNTAPAAAETTLNSRANAKHPAPAGKAHRHEPMKAPSSAPSVPAPVEATSPHPAAPAVTTKMEAPPRLETAPEREPAARSASPPPVVAVRAAAPAPTTPPPPVSRTQEAPTPGFVDPKAVAAAVRAHAAEANACYDRAIMEHPDLHGRLTLRATIDGMGHVVSLSPTSGIDGGARLQSCLVNAFKSWAFPRPAGGVNGTITYSFSFESANPQ